MKSMNIFTSKKESKELIALPPAPIQDENGNITFELEGKVYSLNVNSEEERERVKEAVNSNSLAKYDWFEEVMGEKHWVLYDTAMYEVIHIYSVGSFLHYREGSALAPIIPINATSCFKMFEVCRNLTTLDSSRFNTKNIVDMGCMFLDCENLMSLNVSNFDTSKVTDMGYMFARCSNFIILDLSGFNTSKVTEMRSMFEHCTALLYLDLSRFDTSKVTDMNSMFYRCSNATFIDVANFDTSNVIDMSNMFAYCKSLIKLNLCKFDTSNVASSENMFYYCESLETIYISYKWSLNIYPCPRALL